MGPGSLYTSLLPSLLVPGIREALEAPRGLRVFVCNVATQVGETEGYTLAEHLAALNAHGVGHRRRACSRTTICDARAARDYPGQPVRIDLPAGRRAAAARHRPDVVDAANAHRHDSLEAGRALIAPP